jgi:uncharacterized C2H2 Zn-finger protein
VKNLNVTSKAALALLVVVLCAASFLSQVSAAPTVSISLTRTNGYGWGNDINGHFTVNADVSSDVVKVEFYIDNILQYTVSGSAFAWSFNTENYPLGQHSITAVAYNSAGASQASQALARNFVEVPIAFYLIIGAVVSASIIIAIVSIVLRKRQSGHTKCPQCSYIFARHYSWIHLGNSERTKCPRCGKAFWAKNYDGPIDNEEHTPQSELLSEQERLHRDIEDSKYEKQR